MAEGVSVAEGVGVRDPDRVAVGDVVGEGEGVFDIEEESEGTVAVGEGEGVAEGARE